MDKCMPAAPKMVGREFVKKYYIVMNKSPESLYCFYSDTASFMHDEVDPHQRRTITADGKAAIRDAMLARLSQYHDSKAQILHVETSETIGDCLIVQVVGNISYNESPMRPFSQTIILVPKSPFHYFVQNDIFRFSDFESDDDAADDPNMEIEATMPEQLDQSDWGTQCADIEEFERPSVKQTAPRAADEVIVNGAPVNEVKLDTSDSGLSSDAEKAIVDIQSLNLKNILQEKRSLTKESVMLRSSSASPANDQLPQQPIEATTKAADNQIPQNKNSLFRDSCILTIGNTVNPNIEFDDVKCDEDAKKTGPIENVDDDGSGNVSGSSGAGANDTGKVRDRKRKDKRKAKKYTSSEMSFNESTDQQEKNELQTENNDDRPAVCDPISSTECMAESVADNVSKTEPTADEALEQNTPKPEVKISYADLAKTGTDKWVDEMASRRGSMADKSKPPRPALSRRNSRPGDRPTPNGGERSNDGYSRFSPRNDQLQVFVGNIPHTASEDDIRRMFSRFGQLQRCRFNSNTRKEWLPAYAFIMYDNINSVRQCLMKKGTFYWPETGSDRQKLNVNGDSSVDVWDDNGNPKSNDGCEKTREFKRFSKNFNMHSKDSHYKRSPHTSADPSVPMKSERRSSSTRA